MLLLFALLLVLFLLFSHPFAFSLLYPVHAVIDVDLKHPERNREFLVIPFTDVEKDGVLHNGVEIMIMDGSLQDYLQDRYKAWKIKSNEVLVSVPSAAYHYIEDFSDFFDELKKCPGVHCQRAQLGHDVARNAIMDDSTRHLKHILLRFPEEIVLDPRNYSDSDGELTCDWCSYKTRFEKDGHIFEREHDILFWKIAVEEESSRVLKRTDTTKGAARLSARFASMNMDEE